MLVEVYDSCAVVYTDYRLNGDAKTPYRYVPLIEVPFVNFYPGTDYSTDDEEGMEVADGDGTEHGNNCLIKINDTTFMHINEDLVLFNLPKGEKVIEYISIVSHSDSICPYLVTNKNYYFFDTFTFIPRKTLDEMTDYPPRAIFAKQDMYEPRGKLKHTKIFGAYSKKFTIDKSRFSELGISYLNPDIDPKLWTKQNEFN